jgi:hypothetical protein
MTDKTKSLIYTQKPKNFRYSHSSSNSTENSEIDYNLYCFSQGYKTREKGYWRGVLRNKQVDFDLRFNKEWNYPIVFDDDDIGKTLEYLNKSSDLKSSNELISFVNDNDIKWDSKGFQNFKKVQLKAGISKKNNKEWLLSNGVKRSSQGVELRTQNYKQFEESEKNKEMKKNKLPEDKNAKNQYQIGQWTADKAQKSYKTANDTYNTYNTLSSSANINEQKGKKGSAYTPSGQGKRIDTNFLGQSTPIDSSKRNLATEYNYDQYKRQNLDKKIDSANIGKDKGYDKSKQGMQPKSQTQSQFNKYGKDALNQGYNYNISTTKGYGTEKPTDYITNYATQKDRQEFKYGQKGVPADQKSNIYPKKPTDLKKPDVNKYYLSVDKVKKDKREKIERKPGKRSHERIYSSGKKKLVLDEYGQPLKNTSRLDVSTEKKKPKRERLDNISRLEVNMKSPKKERPQRIPGSRKHERIHSSKKKRKQSYDSEGRPLTNTIRLNVDTSKKKPKRERLDNISKLDVSLDKDNKYTVKKSGSFDKQPRTSYQPDYGTATKNKVKPKVTTDKKYDLKGKPQTGLESKYGKPQNKTTTTQQKRQPIYPDSKPQKTYQPPYSDTKTKPQIQPTSSYTRGQAGTGQQPYYTQPDYSKYNKYQSQTDKKVKESGKKDDKYRQPEKPGYVNQFNLGDKKYQTTLDKQKPIDKNLGSVDYKLKWQTKTTDKKSPQYGIAPDYQQYYKSSRTEQKPGELAPKTNYGTNVTFGTPSQLNTAATIGKTSRLDKMGKSVDRKIDLLSGDTFKKSPIYQSSQKQPYGQTTTNYQKVIPSSQRYPSAPKKPTPGTSKKVPSATIQTPTKKQKLDQYKKPPYTQQQMLNKPESSYKKAQKGTDSIKTDMSKYYQKQTPQSKKQKDAKDAKHKKATGEPEIYEYYPISKTASKPDKYNKNKNVTKQFNYDDLYEYNPVTKVYEYKPGKIKKPQTTDHKRGGALSTDSRYKEDYSSLAKTKATTTNKYLPDTKQISINLDKYMTGQANKKTTKTPSFSYQKDRLVNGYGDNAKGNQAKNNRYLLSPFSDQKSSLQNTSPNLRNSMAYFKCKFLTTKQVCEKFWKSIDSGELSSSMFDSTKVSARNSAAASKLSNFLSPDKYRFSKVSDQNTDYTMKNNGKNKGMIYSNSDAYYKNITDGRQSYQTGFKYN